MRDLITRPSLSLQVVTPKELVEQRISAQAELAKSKQIKDIEYVHYPRLNSYILLTEQDADLENKYISLIYQSPRTFDSVIDRIVRKTYNANVKSILFMRI